MSSSRYTSQVQQWHSQLAPTVPIDAFVSYLDPELLGLENRAQFYAPVEFAVHVQGPISGAAGSVRLAVPVHANPDWLSILQQRIGNMFQRQQVELRTMSGKPLSQVPLDDLERAGKLGVYVDGKRTTLETLPQVPLEYSINKLNTLYQWFGPVKEHLTEFLSKELLRCETPTALIEAIAPNGPMERAIAQQLHDATHDWNEFVRVNHMNSPYALEAQGAQAVLQDIASSIRSTLSDFVQASADDISSFYRSVEAERMAQKMGQDAFKPLYGSLQVKATDGFRLYNDLCKSLFDLPVITEEVVNAIYLKPIEGCRWEQGEEPRRDNAPPPAAGGPQRGGGGGALSSPPAAGGPQRGGGGGALSSPPAAGGPQGGGGTVQLPPSLTDQFSKRFDFLNDRTRSGIMDTIRAVASENLTNVSPQQAFDTLIRATNLIGLQATSQLRTQFRIEALVGTDTEILEQIIILAQFYGLAISPTETIESALSLLANRISEISRIQESERKIYLSENDLQVPIPWNQVQPSPVVVASASLRAQKKDIDDKHEIYTEVELNIMDSIYLGDFLITESERLTKYEKQFSVFDAEFFKIHTFPRMDGSAEKCKTVLNNFANTTVNILKRFVGWSEHFDILALRTFGYRFENFKKLSDAEALLILQKLMHNAHYRSAVLKERFRNAIDLIPSAPVPSLPPPAVPVYQEGSQRRTPSIRGVSLEDGNQVVAVSSPPPPPPPPPSGGVYSQAAALAYSDDRIPHAVRSNAMDKAQEDADFNSLSDAGKKKIDEASKIESKEAMITFFHNLWKNKKMKGQNKALVLSVLSRRVGIPDWSVYPDGAEAIDDSADTGELIKGTKHLMEDIAHYYFLDKENATAAPSVRVVPAAPVFPKPPQTPANRSEELEEEEEEAKPKRSTKGGKAMQEKEGVFVTLQGKDLQDAIDAEWDKLNKTPKASIRSLAVSFALTKDIPGRRNILSAKKFSGVALKMIALMYGRKITIEGKIGDAERKQIIDAILGVVDKVTPVQPSNYDAASMIEDHNPYNAHIHHTLKSVGGGYPSYYMLEHTQRDLTEAAPFAGDVDETYRAYHMFANAHPMPEAAPIGKHLKKKEKKEAPAVRPIECAAKEEDDEDMKFELPPLIPYRKVGTEAPAVRPIECGAGGRKGKKRDEEDMESELPTLIPYRKVGTEAPPVRPIECHAGRRKKKEEDMKFELPPLIPYNKAVGSEAPPVRPIECGAGRRKKEKEEDDMKFELPPLVPYKKKGPELVSASVAEKMRERLVRVEKKIPDTGHGFVGLPEVDDLF